MALTIILSDFLQRRVGERRRLRRGARREGIDTMPADDFDTGKSILRDYVKATVGFEECKIASNADPTKLAH